MVLYYVTQFTNYCVLLSLARSQRFLQSKVKTNVLFRQDGNHFVRERVNPVKRYSCKSNMRHFPRTLAESSVSTLLCTSLIRSQYSCHPKREKMQFSGKSEITLAQSHEPCVEDIADFRTFTSKASPKCICQQLSSTGPSVSYEVVEWEALSFLNIVDCTVAIARCIVFVSFFRHRAVYFDELQSLPRDPRRMGFDLSSGNSWVGQNRALLPAQHAKSRGKTVQSAVW